MLGCCDACGYWFGCALYADGLPAGLILHASTPSLVLDLPTAYAVRVVAIWWPSTADDSRERPQAVFASREAEAAPTRIHKTTALSAVRLCRVAWRRLSVRRSPPRHARDCRRIGLEVDGIIA